MTVAIRARGVSKRYVIRHRKSHPVGPARAEAFAQAGGLGRTLATLRAASDGLLGVEREEFWALNDIDLDVGQGETLGIIGRNGSGKSTLLKILMRITMPTRGRIGINGRASSLLEVGTGFHPELTGRENIYLNGVILGMSKARIRSVFDEIVAFSEVEKFLDTPVKRYSSGMYVRLAFAVAAHLEADILAIDEVLAVGDVGFQRKCLGKLEDIGRAGRTVLFVSHNMGVMKRFCSECIWLDNGEIQERGESGRIIDQYLKSQLRSDSEAACRFETDPSKDFQVLQVELIDRMGRQAQVFSCDDPIVIRIRCNLRVPLPGLYGYLSIDRADGEVVLISDSNDLLMGALANLPVGEQSIEITVPSRTLGPGEYTILLSFASIYSSKGFIVDNPGRLFSFHLADSTTKRGNNRGGYFSTLLPWQPSAPAGRVGNADR